MWNIRKEERFVVFWIKKRGKIRFTGMYIKKNCTFAKSVNVIKCNNDGAT